MVGLDCQKNTVGRFYGLPLNIRKNPAKGLPFALGQGGVNVARKRKTMDGNTAAAHVHMPLRKSRQSIPLPHPL